jgi:excisionase family DNA binding protein
MNVGRILILSEVAEILRTSIKTVRRRIASGELRAFKEGGRVCVLLSDVEEYLHRKIQNTATR